MVLNAEWRADRGVQQLFVSARQSDEGIHESVKAWRMLEAEKSFQRCLTIAFMSTSC